MERGSSRTTWSTRNCFNLLKNAYLSPLPRDFSSSSMLNQPSSVTDTLNSSWPLLFESPVRVKHESPVLMSHSLASPLLLQRHSWEEMSPTAPVPFETGSPSLSPLSFSESILPPFQPELSPQTQYSPLIDSTTRKRRSKNSRAATVLKVLKELQEAKLTTIDVLLEVIKGKGDLEGYHYALFSPKNRSTLLLLLDNLLDDAKGRLILEDWMEPHSTSLVCKKIHSEMDAAKPLLRMTTKEVTPEFIAQWDINALMQSVDRVTPTWSTILDAASEGESSRLKAKTLRSRNRVTVSLYCHDL